MSNYNFEATIASRGYHVYKETTWSNAKVNEKVKIEIETKQTLITIDPFACAIKSKNKKKYFDRWKNCWSCPERNFVVYLLFYQKRKPKNHWQRKIVHLFLPEDFRYLCN